MTEDLSLSEQERLLERLQRTLVSHHHRVVIAVFSTSNRGVEQQHIRSTWGLRALRAGIPVVFVVGIPQHIRSVRADTIAVPLDDSACMSSEKLCSFLEYAKTHWSFDMILSVTDTSYVHVERALQLPEKKVVLGATQSIQQSSIIPATRLRTFCASLKDATFASEIQVFSELQNYAPERERVVLGELLAGSLLTVDELPADVLFKWHLAHCEQLEMATGFRVSTSGQLFRKSVKKIMRFYRISVALLATEELSVLQGIRSRLLGYGEQCISWLQTKRGGCLYIDCTDASLTAYSEMLLARQGFVVKTYVQAADRRIAKQSLAFLHPEQVSSVHLWKHGDDDALSNQIQAECRSYRYCVMALSLREQFVPFIEACLSNQTFQQCSFTYLELSEEGLLEKYWPMIKRLQRQTRVLFIGTLQDTRAL